MDTEETTTEPTQDAEDHIKSVITAISAGDNVSAGDSFNQVMQAKRDSALEIRKTTMSGNLFTPPEPTSGIDTGITGDPAEVGEE